MDAFTQHNFNFMATQSMSDERKQMGWQEETPAFLRQYYAGKEIDETSRRMIDEADVVIVGNAPPSAVKKRLSEGKMTFQYSERLYKKSYQRWKWPVRMYRMWKAYGRFSRFYLLCASAFTAADFAKTHTFVGKAYKWGYFPETKQYDVSQLLANKKKNRILWCGRLIDWKHPDDVIMLAHHLQTKGYDFHLQIIGTGEMEEQLKTLSADYHLENCVEFLGAMSPEAVRAKMEEAGIYLFTSDRGEGWGAVLNESMNSGCAVVASHAIGSVPFLLTHKENGLVYKSGNLDDLFSKVEYLLDHPKEREEMGKKAYHTIADLWNAQVAAERFLRLVKEIEDHGYCDLYTEGPCSPAPKLKDHWFKE